MTAVNGAVVWSAKYTSFGHAIVDSLSEVENNLRFSGQYFDKETRLHYNWARYYCPFTGRFLRIDPIGFMGGDYNLYGYVNNNSLRWIDPFGLKEEEAFKWMEKNLKGVPPGYYYYNPDTGKWKRFQKGKIPSKLYCFQACWTAYRNVPKDPYKDMPYSRMHAYDWFKSGGEERRIAKDPCGGEKGDIMFLGEPGSMEGHAVLVEEVVVNPDGSYTVKTLGQFASGNVIGKRDFIITKDPNNNWVADNEQVFRGYGQIMKK